MSQGTRLFLGRPHRRLCLLALLAVFLLMRAAGSEAAPGGGIDGKMLEGRLSVMDTHEEGNLQWYIITGANPLDPRSRTIKLPESFETGIAAGKWVQLTCRDKNQDSGSVARKGKTSKTSTILSCDKVVSIQEKQLPGTGLPDGFSAARVDQQDLALLIIILSFKGDCVKPQGYSVEQVKAIYFGDNGLASFFSGCSYGKLNINRDKYKIVMASLPCDRSFEQCNQVEISVAANEAAEKQIGPLNMFTNVHYIMPRGIIETCPKRWTGLAEAPGMRVWLQPDVNGLENKGTVLQETLHNYGLMHSWRGGREYQDGSTCMGMGRVCPSPYELNRMGWATALAVLEELDIKAGTQVRYVLSATYLPQSAQGAFLKIKPTWLGATWISNLYIGYRARGGADYEMVPEFDKKVIIHRVDRTIDDVPADGVSAQDPYVELVGIVDTISPEWQGTRYRVVVRAGALLEGGTKSEVFICWYNNEPSECSGAATQDGSRASPVPSTTTPSPSPPPPPVVNRSPPPSPPPPSSSPPPSPRPPAPPPPPSVLPPRASSPPAATGKPSTPRPAAGQPRAQPQQSPAKKQPLPSTPSSPKRSPVPSSAPTKRVLPSPSPSQGKLAQGPKPSSKSKSKNAPPSSSIPAPPPPPPPSIPSPPIPDVQYVAAASEFALFKTVPNGAYKVGCNYASNGYCLGQPIATRGLPFETMMLGPSFRVTRDIRLTRVEFLMYSYNTPDRTIIQFKSWLYTTSDGKPDFNDINAVLVASAAPESAKRFTSEISSSSQQPDNVVSIEFDAADPALVMKAGGYYFVGISSDEPRQCGISLPFADLLPTPLPDCDYVTSQNICQPPLVDCVPTVYRNFQAGDWYRQADKVMHINVYGIALS